jgi:hypothetical protein
MDESKVPFHRGRKEEDIKRKATKGFALQNEFHLEKIPLV